MLENCGKPRTTTAAAATVAANAAHFSSLRIVYKCNLIDSAATINYFRVEHAIRSIWASWILHAFAISRSAGVHSRENAKKNCANPVDGGCCCCITNGYLRCNGSSRLSNLIFRCQSCFIFQLISFQIAQILFTYSTYPALSSLLMDKTYRIFMQNKISID